MSHIGQLNGARSFDREEVADLFARLSVEAAVAVMQVYETRSGLREKPDHSPVCDADERAEAIILDGLAKHLPGIPVLAEEAAARGVKPACGSTFILVDPVDGTREFLSHNGEFTINIALIQGGVPCAGAVYAPALERLWMAGSHAFTCSVAPGKALPPGSEWHPISVRKPSSHGLVALASRSHCDPQTEAFLADLPILERRSAGSSLKFCAIAEGEADVYPRFGPTMEWDTAAGDAVLRAAGGAVLDVDGRPLAYGKAHAQYKNGAFVAWGDRQGRGVKARLTDR